MNNKTIMQFFEWYLPADCTLWDKLRKEASLYHKDDLKTILDQNKKSKRNKKY